MRSFLLLILFGAFATVAHAALPIERFVEKPSVVGPQLSPNGRYLATPIRDNGRSVIAVHDLQAGAGAQPALIYTEDLDIDWIEWANDERILIALVADVPLMITPPTGSRVRKKLTDLTVRRIFAVNKDGSNPIGLLTPDRRFGANLDLTQLVHKLPDQPQHVVIAANNARRKFDLYRVNVYTGALEVAAEGNDDTDSWLTDLAGVARVRWDYDYKDESYTMFLRRGDGDQWDKITTYSKKDLPDLKVVGFSDDPKVAIVASRQSGDRQGLYEFDMATHRLGKPLFSHASVDVGSPFGNLIYAPDTRRLLGLTYVEDLWRVHYFDAELARAQAEADAAFPDSAIVRVTSWSDDRAHVIFYTEGPKDAGTYYLVDRKKGTSEPIGRRYPQLQPSALGEVAIIKYPARDGAKITGYLTLPPGRGDKNLPMVVLPHGGPELRDSVVFDSLAQMMANQGYMVFQPNFRGSGGYGRAFAEAGHRQWGRRMQDDITDGVKALIAEGSADPKRICIVGGSYGGYAALAGGAFTPELYKCVISFAGVSDLVEIVETERRAGVESSVYRYWAKRIGDPRADREEMEAWSPSKHADKFTAPVLLIHGEWDGVVPYEQSQFMERALSAANKPVELIRVRKDGHDFAKPESRLLLFGEIQKFLAQQLGR